MSPPSKPHSEAPVVRLGPHTNREDDHPPPRYPPRGGNDTRELDRPKSLLILIEDEGTDDDITRFNRHKYNGEESDEDSMPSLHLPRIDFDTDSDSDDESCITSFPPGLYHHKDPLDEPQQHQTKDDYLLSASIQPAPTALPQYIVCDVSPPANVPISEHPQVPPPRTQERVAPTVVTTTASTPSDILQVCWPSPSAAPSLPSPLQDISIFHQPSLSSEGSRSFEAPTPETNTDGIGNEPDHEPSKSSGSSFDSKFSSSTIASAPPERHQPTPFCSIPQPIPETDTQPPATVIPEILSQDQTLIASWQRLFAKASRPHGNIGTIQCPL
jgi:hypothetical protein